MKRRDFLTVIGGAVAWSAGAGAQTAMPVVGFLHGASPGSSSHFVAAFRDGLRQTGFVEGKNVRVEYRWAEGRYDRLPGLARELVGLNVAALLTAGGALPTLAAKQVTSSIPIVFEVGDDPIKAGLVDNLNRPSGNVTGATFFGNELGQKRFELIRQLGPYELLSVLVNPNGSTAAAHLTEIERSAADHEQKLNVSNLNSADDLETAFASMQAKRAGGLIVTADPLFFALRKRIVERVDRLGIPAIYYTREYVEDGGLMSYGTSIANATREAAVYVGKVLKGARISDLPVLLPTRFEFVVNMRTAKSHRIALPPTLFALADEVIE